MRLLTLEEEGAYNPTFKRDTVRDQLTIDLILKEHAKTSPDRIAYTFLVDGESKEVSVTYQELDLRAAQIAFFLKNKKKTSPSVALLVYPPGLGFLNAFFGCLYAGVIAVPMPIPKKASIHERMGAIISDTGASLLLTDRVTREDLQRHTSGDVLQGVEWVATDDLVCSASEVYFENKAPSSLAFLQYTSGSTGSPKGVMVTHANIIENQKMIQAAFGHDENTVFVGWLPLFHDMGLIGNILQPMYLGIPSVLFSPVAFLQKPARWLQAIARYGATTSGAPNFAYDLCVDKINPKDLEGIDLSSWKVAFNGAEPIRGTTLQRFASRFNPYGFNTNAFYPCYGMAEATVFVSGNVAGTPLQFMTVDKRSLESHNLAVPIQESNVSDVTLVGVGKSWMEGTCAIVDPINKAECEPYAVGEVWIKGPHIAAGYWNRLEASQETFQATLDRETDYLRTGDLGFLDSLGNLFITGRLKDLIIIRGRNVYPQDIELVVEKSDSSLNPGGTAAFGIVEKEQESLVIIAEVKREKMRHLNKDALFAAVRRAVMEECQVAPQSIVLIKPHSLPKTSSGKVQRALCKKLFQEKKLDVVLESSFLQSKIETIADTEVESIHSLLSLKVAEILHIPKDEICASVALVLYGIDSLNVFELQLFIQEKWNLFLNVEELLSYLSIQSITDQIIGMQGQVMTESRERSDLFLHNHRVYPLSYQQLNILADAQIAPDTFGYNLVKVIEILSPLDIPRLKIVIGILMERHEMLRTLFSLKETHQTVADSATVPLFEMEINEDEFAFFLENQSLSTLTLEGIPLFYILVLKSGLRRFLFLKAHHLIADLWSLGIFLEELLHVYHDIGQGVSHALPVTHSYSDYVLWQRSSLEDARMQKVLEYWEKKAINTLCSFPIETIQPGTETSKGLHHNFTLSAGLSEKIKTFAAHLHTTPFAVLMSAYFLLLSHYSGGKELCIGTTSHGRTNSKWHNSFGCFSNPLPLFITLSPYQSFSALVGEVQTEIKETLNHFQLPFYYLLQHLQRSRDGGAMPLFKTMFVYQQVPTLSKELCQLIFSMDQEGTIVQRGELQIRPVAWQPPISPIDCVLFMYENNGLFFGCFEYKSNLFQKSTLLSLQADFITFLEWYLEEPSRLVSSLPLALLSSDLSNGTASCYQNYNKPLNLVEAFHEKARAFPLHAALCYGNVTMSYQGLDVCSNQFARLLIKEGVCPDSIVAVMLPHSPELIIALLGILKTGAAFLPMHATTPLNRIQAMLKDSKAILMVTERLDLSLSVKTLDIRKVGEQSDQPLPNLVENDSLAYVMYTSGSTGTPKGVSISHGALLSYLFAIKDHYKIDDFSHFPLYSSLAFDLTLTSVFLPLLFAHTIHIFSEKADIDKVINAIFDHPLITHVKLTPSHLSLLEDREKVASRVSQLIVGGEQLSFALTERIHAKFTSPLEIVNEYGPTEATIGCIYFIYPSAPVSTGILPIGTSIKSMRHYLLDNFLKEVPQNVAGDLYLAGAGLSYGYWNNAYLTAEKFVPDPNAVGERMYNSGDEVKLIDPAVLLCLGRSDRQVKIRGFRIELDEISACIQSYPGIRECIVIVDQKSTSDSQLLVAYFTCDETVTFSSQDLQDFIRTHLPHYMVPNLLVPCDEIPLTTNGKVDLNMLAKLPRSCLDHHQATLPSSGLQKTLVALWAQVLLLEQEQIGITRSFFELGGDSIKAIQIVNKCRGEHICFSVRDLFNYPTIELLARQIERNQNRESVCTVVEVAQSEKCHLAPMQKWFFAHCSHQLNHYNQTVLLKYRYPNNLNHLTSGDLGIEKFDADLVDQAFRKIIEHHDSLRMVFAAEGLFAMIQNSTDDVFRLDVFDLRQGRDSKIKMQEAMDSLQASLDIFNGPLIRLALFETAEGSFLFITIHHLIIDGVSWHILLEDFDRVYTALQMKEPVFIGKKTSAYQTWANHQKECFEKLLPSQEFRVADQIKHSLVFPEEITTQLIFDVHKAYHTTLSDLFLTTLYLSLYAVTKERSLSLHLEQHGRELSFSDKVDLTCTIGWFTSLARLHLEVLHVGEENLPTIIKTVKEQTRVPEGQINHTHPTISFNYLGQVDAGRYHSFTFQPILEGLVGRGGQLPYALQLNFFIMEHQLHCHFIFDTLTYPKEIQEIFIKKYQEELLKITQHCLERENPEYTPSDFGLKGWSSWRWDDFAKNIVSKSFCSLDNVSHFLPVSPLQQGLLYHLVKDKGSTAYIEQVLLSLEGNVVPVFFQRSLENLVDDHESLRASFFYEPQYGFQQVIYKKRELLFLYEDLSSKEESLRELHVDTYLKQDREKGFNVESGSLLRVALFRIGEDRFSFVMSFHHLILDGWSLGLFFRAFFENLSLLHQQKALIASPSTSTLTPYFNWLLKQDREQALGYWKNLIGDFEDQTCVPKTTFVPKARKMTPKVTSRSIFSKKQVHSLTSIGNRHCVTLNSLFQMIWVVLLSSYTQSNDIVFGTVISGRSTEVNDIENGVGLFIQTVPVRIKVSGVHKLLDIARLIQEQILDNERFACLSLGEIQALSPLKQNLMDHLLVFENYPLAGQVEEYAIETSLPFSIKSAELIEETQYDFLLSFIPSFGSTMTMEIQYNDQLYVPEFVDSIHMHFISVIQSLSSDPAVCLGDIQLTDISSSELTKQEIPFVETTLSELFEAQAKRVPNSTAVVCDGKGVTYGYLNSEADQLASYLVSLGLRAEDGVAIFLERSHAMVISWLAVLKAGGFYLPLDSSCVAERMETICRETNIAVLLTSSSLFSRVPTLQDVKVVQLDLEWPLIKNEALLQKIEPPDAGQLAYVLYTSGSTGVPKGIGMTHKAICSHLSWIIRRFGLKESDRMLQLTAFSFDVAVCEFYALLVGATLVLAPMNVGRDVELLLNTIEKERISFLQLVPSLLEVLLQRELFQRMRSVRQVLCGADILRKEHVDKWFEHSSIPLTNLYGLTETCIDTMYYDCMELKKDVIPIGKPISNSDVYVLNQQLAELPKEVPGRLYIGGFGLARGYYQRADLTAERFIPHPFKPGERVYDTADLVVQKMDGNFYYLGRGDSQVKIRGFRVEMKEIEALLSQYPNIQKVLVKTFGDDINKAICAYFVSKVPVETALLRTFLEKKLPYYMIPDHFIPIEQFPLTPHGKIDTTALPNPFETKTNTNMALAQNETEHQIEDLWKIVLKVPHQRLPMDINFFDFGGNSLALMQLHYHLSQTFNKKIELEQLFLYPTIRSLAHFMRGITTVNVDVDGLTQRAEKRSLRFQQKR